jgi:peptide/nickel transport system permease protein
LRGHDLVVAGAGAVLVLVACAAVAAPWIARHDPTSGDLRTSTLPPAFSEGGSREFPLGTDQLGRDILSRVIFGARVSLLVGFVAMACSGALGVACGLVAGYYGGKADAFLMRLADVQLSIPTILLAINIMAVVGANVKNVILTLGITGWVAYARVVRGEVLTMRAREFVEAARSLGAYDARILGRYVLPNVIPSVVIIGTFTVAQMIIAEAALSFLGLGVQPPTPTWGGMLADGRGELATAWWLATFPGLAIVATVLAVNLIGDWLRDRLDPRLRTEG